MAEVIAQLEQQVASQKKELEYARWKIQVLEERLRLQRIQKYGPNSENNFPVNRHPCLQAAFDNGSSSCQGKTNPAVAFSLA